MTGATLLGVSLGAAAPAAAIDMVSPTGNPNNICAVNPRDAPVRDPGVCRTDNRNWVYYMDSGGTGELEAEDRQAATAGMSAWGNNTVMNVSYDSTPVFSGNAQTDVVFQEGGFGAPDSIAAVTWCVSKVDGKPWVCDSQYIRMRGAGTYNKWLVAHESGHALGLTHGTEARPAVAGNAPITGIMTTGQLPSSLGGEPIAQVNNNY